MPLMHNRFEGRAMEIVPIKTNRDYRRTLKEIEGLMTAKRNTPEGDRLDVSGDADRGLGGAELSSRLYPTRSPLSTTTWNRTGSRRKIWLPISAVATGCTKC